MSWWLCHRLCGGGGEREGGGEGGEGGEGGSEGWREEGRVEGGREGGGKGGRGEWGGAGSIGVGVWYVWAGEVGGQWLYVFVHVCALAPV
jgi:hypothetical protein